MHWLIAAILTLQPVLDDAGPIRLVASGTGDHPVTWTIDGRHTGTSGDREPLRIHLDAGEHTIEAHTDHDGAWRILARPDAAQGTGAHHVDAWTAASTGAHGQAYARASLPWGAMALGACGLALLLWPRRSEAGK